MADREQATPGTFVKVETGKTFEAYEGMAPYAGGRQQFRMVGRRVTKDGALARNGDSRSLQPLPYWARYSGRDADGFPVTRVLVGEVVRYDPAIEARLIAYRQRRAEIAAQIELLEAESAGVLKDIESFYEYQAGPKPEGV